MAYYKWRLNRGTGLTKGNTVLKGYLSSRGTKPKQVHLFPGLSVPFTCLFMKKSFSDQELKFVGLTRAKTLSVL